MKKGSKSQPTVVELPLKRIETVSDEGRELVEELNPSEALVTYKVSCGG